ncbi:uncharacterized protein Z519_12100 [Cladophialophora bantiana CBS 173.52]|uniref:Aminoglycoside phosphotransferase domain-containing protein n=1 Tax=Cladophialophora bantiana (strain ATCC 10958 / CBS 173.52 / CDC B-1940 / NIH 8579) TaxID=1442370 RepID=A0A0D2H1P2_CLAB1|nr:uncharacterized protein Z519_12100 [Cladophialophora bantiana CBS 173.52]KIW87198.1 hypothetical protein Z519_12100 [Cladophialophora bantiana CBS 173.52]
MPVTLPLLRENITYDEARHRETNILLHLTYPRAQLDFYNFINRRQKLIQERVAHHLGLPSPSLCRVAHWSDWMSGSYNLCVPVTIADLKRVLIRFPLPYRVGDKVHPGNCDEKLRCEAATYAWMHDECPDVRIPHLYGFALSNGRCFTAVEHRPLLVRLYHYLRSQFLSCLGRRVPSNLVPHRSGLSNELGGYLVIEYIDQEQGQMLSKTWETGRMDDRLRKNLFRSLSQVMLRIGRVCFPQIGSFIIDDQGFIRLKNRPLTLEIQDLENSGIPIGIPRDRTYNTVDSYVNDLLSCHDKRLCFQPNAVHNGADCAAQMSALTIMRAVRPEFFRPELNHGPFCARLTDMNANNLIVDENWNIKCLIDLEWMAILPQEFMQPPSWLTSQAVDEVDIEEYNKLREEFMAVFEQEEECLRQVESGLRYSPTMKTGWGIGTFWYVLALRSPTGLHSIFYDRIQPRFCKEHNDDVHFFTSTYPYWTSNATAFMKRKVQDTEIYDKKLREMFQSTPHC